MLTFHPFPKGKTGVSGTESVTQEFFLEVNHRLQHCLILDLSGWNHNAAVHEVSDGICDLF